MSKEGRDNPPEDDPVGATRLRLRRGTITPRGEGGYYLRQAAGGGLQDLGDPEEYESEEHLFKVILVGDPTVGKTSFVQRYVQDTFRRDYKTTMGVDFALKIIRWSDTDTVKLQLWDIAGQERLRWLSRVYYKDADGCIVMFDLTNRNSFDNCAKWRKDVQEKCCASQGGPIPCIMLANKCDLSHQQVEQVDIERLYQDKDFIGWTETSVKEGLMVNDSVRFLVDIMMQQRIAGGDCTSRAVSPMHLTASTQGEEAASSKKCYC